MKKNPVTSKISVKLLITIPFCIVLSFVATGLLASYVSNHYIIPNKDHLSPTMYNILAIGFFLFGIISFIISFLLIINKKIKYIRYIAESIKKISHEELGSEIEIRGNDELAEVCRSINYMSRELKDRLDKEKELENTKNELITNVSHDLRTPLTSIIGYVDLLRKKEYKNEEQLSEYVDTVYHKSINLQKLINELFEYTKLTSPGFKLDYTEVDLAQLLEQLIGEYMPIFESEGLTIKKDIPAEDIIVKVDVNKIIRVLENILINAVKYSDKPSAININMHIVQDRVVISVSNKFKNMNIKDLDKLFEKFFRVDASRTNEGTGLGLAIAKRITELHEGEIRAEYINDTISFNIELKVYS